VLVAERIDLKAWSAADAPSINPLTVAVKGGRAEMAEKPEILWDNPALEGLFARLEDEFEIRERHAAIERKLNLISRTTHTVLELVSSKHSLRVEWYILILFEILLTLYQLFFR